MIRGRRFVLVRNLIVLMITLLFILPFGTATSAVVPSSAPTLVAQSSSIHPANDFVKASNAEPESLDPAWDYESAGWEVIQNVYEGLVAFQQDDPTTLAPVLCTEVPSVGNGLVSSDGMHYTFNLRSNVLFHDGSIMTADDVMYSIERVLVINDAEGPSWMLAQIMLPGYAGAGSNVNWDDVNASMTKVDDDTITFNLIRPYSGFLSILAMTVGSVVSKAFVEAHGGLVPNERNDYLRNHTCGTGPFMLREWSIGSHWTLTRFDNYHGTPATLDSVTCKKVVDFGARKAMIVSGEADSIDFPSMLKSEIEGLPGTEIFQGPSPSLSFIAFNQDIVESSTMPLGDIPLSFFADVNVRKAFLHAFDYETYLHEVMGGTATQPNGPIPNGMFGYDPDIPFYDHNLSKSAECLKRAKDARTLDPNDSYADNGFHLIMYSLASSTDRNNHLDLLKLNLERLSRNATMGVTGNITIDVEYLDWPTYLNARAERWLPTLFMGWSFDYPDPDDFAYPLCHQNGSISTIAGLKNQSLTAFVEEGALEPNDYIRKQIYSEISRSCYENAYYLWTQQPLKFVVMRDWVQGYVYNPVDAGLRYYGFSFSSGGLPSAPQNLAAFADDGETHLTWHAPTVTGEGTLTYHLFRDGALIWSGYDDHCTDTGLTNEQTYTYKVAAHNSVGWGPNSTEAQVTPRDEGAEGVDNTTFYIVIGAIILIAVAGAAIIMMRRRN